MSVFRRNTAGLGDRPERQPELPVACHNPPLQVRFGPAGPTGGADAPHGAMARCGGTPPPQGHGALRRHPGKRRGDLTRGWIVGDRRSCRGGNAGAWDRDPSFVATSWVLGSAVSRESMAIATYAKASAFPLVPPGGILAHCEVECSARPLAPDLWRHGIARTDQRIGAGPCKPTAHGGVS